MNQLAIALKFDTVILTPDEARERPDPSEIFTGVDPGKSQCTIKTNDGINNYKAPNRDLYLDAVFIYNLL